MITRDWLETHLPNSPKVRLLARNFSGINFHEANAVERALIWLEGKQKEDKGSNWRDHPASWENHKAEYWWEVRIHGLSYKDSDEYLTLEGWNIGSTCWYVCFEAGFKEYIAAETPRLALIRSIIAVQSYVACRELGPVPDLREAIEHFAKGLE